MLSGLTFGLGNTVFGINCSQLGFWGSTYPGPIACLILLSNRLIQMCRNKFRSGSFIDYEHSNYWTKVEDSSSSYDSVLAN